jgi:hypothetical protein
MAHSLRTHAASILTLAALAVVPLAVSIVACGGGEAQPVTPPPSATASATPPASTDTAAATASATASTPPADTTPPPPPPVPTSAVATTKSDASWAGCHQSYKAKGKDVARDVAEMAASCAKVTKMKKLGKTLKGKQADQDAPQTYPFDAKANHCYRVYAQATESIQDLDIVIKDSAGIVAGQDSTDDPSPVVLEDGAVCFSKDDKASAVVSVGMGKGSYAVEIWSD